MSNGVRNGRSILDLMTGRGVDRRKLIRSGLQAGAALGVAGMAGLTVVGGPGTAAAQEDPTIDPNAPEWEPGVEPRSPRKYRWEPLAADQSALPTGLEVRTIGLGVSVQDRFLNEFERRTGHSSSGKVTTLTAMITEWLAGGAQNYDTNETNANRNAALWDTGLLQAIPVEQVIPWKYARDTYTSTEALGYDPVSEYPLTEVWVDPTNQTEFKLVPQFYNCDSIGYRYDLTEEDITSWGSLLDEKYAGKVAILNDSLLTPGWAAGYLKASGQIDIARTDNMTHEELDQVIDYMIERKRAGQFRATSSRPVRSGWPMPGTLSSRTSRNRTSSANTPRQRKGLLPGSTESRCRKTPRTSRRRSTTSTSVSRDGGARRWRCKATTPRPRPATSTCRRRGTPAPTSPTTSGGTRAARARSRRKAGR
jgi:hypothetical protein